MSERCTEFTILDPELDAMASTKRMSFGRDKLSKYSFSCQYFTTIFLQSDEVDGGIEECRLLICRKLSCNSNCGLGKQTYFSGETFTSGGRMKSCGTPMGYAMGYLKNGLPDEF